MQDPRLHQLYDAERRADLVRHARRNELAESVRASRHRDHGSFLERLRSLRRKQETPAAPAAPEL